MHGHHWDHPDYRGVLISECPDYRGVLISECPDYRGVLISECPDYKVSLFQIVLIIQWNPLFAVDLSLRKKSIIEVSTIRHHCPDYRGVLISECPDYRGVLISECPDYRGVLISE